MLMALLGCSDEQNERLLTRAEAYMETRADSARWLLQQVDSVLTDEQQARYALLWTQAMHKCHIPLGNDSLINVAVDYYGQTEDNHRLAKSLLYKGLVHKQRGEVELATKAFVGSEQAFSAITETLTALGADIQETSDSLIIQGKDTLTGGVRIDCRGDHRIAMMLAIAATRCTSPVTLAGAECVNKSYPGFWSDFASLGGIIHEHTGE